MPSSTRIAGKKLALKLGTPVVDHWQDVTQWLLTNEEADSAVTTFADAAAGGSRQYLLNVSGIQSTDTASFWSLVWDKSGTDVAFTVAPHGNAAPSATQPHFIGTCTVGPKPDIGGEAGAEAYTFDTVFKVIGVPVKVIA
ncbi:hypothetical protein BWO91_17295 [Plantibacter flavus]|uniref:hypothetical protein n=1 Tax=Plantibacter flavus TaxID=150123 RepID=UPI00099D09E1|nr:hypothetical protein [Plantibacter flavus]AQX81482.1 hypothetical protein BWO91_17295 [Plantibacter flavus]